MAVQTFTVGDRTIHYDTVTGTAVDDLGRSLAATPGTSPGGATAPTDQSGQSYTSAIVNGQLVLAPTGQTRRERSAATAGEPVQYATGGPGTTAAGTPRDSSGDASTTAQFTSILRQYGLDALIPQVDTWVRNGETWDQVWVQLMDPTTDAGKVVDSIYPEMREVRQNGLPAVSISDILNNRTFARQALSSRGLDKYIDPAALAHQWTVGGTSPVEANARLDAVAADALAFAQNDPQAKRDLEAWTRFYGVAPTAADIVKMAVNPSLAVTELQQRAQAVQLDASSLRTGFGPLSVGEAQNLAREGVSSTQAQSTFGNLVNAAPLFSPLDAGEDPITRQEQLDAGFSNSAAAQKRIQDRAARRVALLQGGGTVAQSRSGLSGLSTQAS